MANYDHYLYPDPCGYVICETGVEPAGWTQRWGINETKTQQIVEGGNPIIVNGQLVVVPSPQPNNGDV